MKRKFNTIKKSRKKSKDIDEKIEYLNKECQKTGLNEIMNTSGIYFSTGQEPNPAHTTFGNTSFNGKELGLTSFSGKSIGGSTNASGHSISPDGQRVAKTYQGIANGFQARPPGYQRTPEHRKVGAFLWYWNGTRYDRLEWKYDNQSQGNGGQWAQWKSGMFPYLDPIIGDPSFDPNLLAVIIAAGGGGAAFPDPDDITPPTNPVLFKNDLGDPGFVPVDSMSPQSYEYIKNKAEEELLAGTYDLMKRGQVPFLTPSQVDKILVDPKYQQLLQDDPDLIKQLQRMRASNSNVPDGTEIAGLTRDDAMVLIQIIKGSSERGTSSQTRTNAIKQLQKHRPDILQHLSGLGYV